MEKTRLLLIASFLILIIYISGCTKQVSQTKESKTPDINQPEQQQADAVIDAQLDQIADEPSDDLDDLEKDLIS